MLAGSSSAVAKERSTDGEFLLHDALHLSARLRPTPRPLLSSTAAAASASSTRAASRLHVRRLTPSRHGADGLGAIALPSTPIDASHHARDIVLQWKQSRADDLAIVGRPLLTDCLQADDALARRRRRCDQYAGNALRVLPGTDGCTPHLLHVQGEHMDTLALRSMDDRGVERSEPPPPICTCALPAGQSGRLRQVALCASDEVDASEPRRIAVRSTYWVHHYELSHDSPSAASGGGSAGGGGGGESQLRHVASSKVGSKEKGNLLGGRPLHTALNPALRGEGACVSDDGRLRLLLLDRADAPSGARVSSRRDTVYEYAVADIGRIALSSGQLASDAASAAASSAAGSAMAVDEPWGCVEYAEHPRHLYVASGRGLYLADARAASAAPTLLFDVSRLPLPEMRAGSMATPRSTRLIPHLGVGGGGGGGTPSAPLVALASSEQLVVIDARAARTPLHQMRMPLPLPAHPAHGAAGIAPLPRYAIEFSASGDALLMVETTSARPFLVPLGGASDARAYSPISGRGSYAHGHPLAQMVPRSPVLPVSLDSESLLSRHAAVMEAYSMGSVLPLAGAAVFPLPQRTRHRDDEAVTNVGAAWAVAMLSARGDVDMLCESSAGDERLEDDSPRRRTVPSALRRSPRRAEASASCSPAQAAPTAAAAAKASWEPQLVEKRDARRDAALDQFRVVSSIEVDALLGQLRERSASPAVSRPQPAVQPAELGSTSMPSSAPFTPAASSSQDPIISRLTAQWDEWSAASAQQRSRSAEQPNVLSSSRRQSMGLGSGKRKDASSPAADRDRVATSQGTPGGSSQLQSSQGSQLTSSQQSSNPFRLGKSDKAAKKKRRSSGF